VIFPVKLHTNRLIGAMLMIALAAGLYGCAPPYQFVLEDDGQQIRLATIDQIVSDQSLTEDRKREELRELGIEDEELIDLLIRQAI